MDIRKIGEIKAEIGLQNNSLNIEEAQQNGSRINSKRPQVDTLYSIFNPFNVIYLFIYLLSISLTCKL